MEFKEFSISDNTINIAAIDFLKFLFIQFSPVRAAFLTPAFAAPWGLPTMFLANLNFGAFPKQWLSAAEG